MYLLNPEIIDQEGNACVSEELLKLLHVFILPEILLHEKDRPYITKALEEIEKQQQKIEDEIQAKERTKRNTEKSLWKQRQDLLRRENFSSAKYIGTLDETFLKVLLKHIKKDLAKLNEILLKTDGRVASLRSSSREKEIEQLTKAREEQTEVFSVIQSFTTAREEIKNVIERKHSKPLFKRPKSHMTDFHLIYVEVNRRLEKICVDLWDLVKRKVKLSSVREAAKLTLKEIQSDGCSYGFNRKKGTFEKELDLFDPSNKPEAWTTLEEKVKSILYNNQCGFGSDYVKFCDMIRTKCEQAQNECKLFGSEPVNVPNTPPLSPGTEALVNRIGRESVQRRTVHYPNKSGSLQPQERDGVAIRRQSACIPRWSMAPISQNTCEIICQEVKDHIKTMSIRLATELKGNECRFIEHNYVNKVYVCYEQHVSDELTPILSEMFEINYRQKCASLSQWVKDYSSELEMESIMRGLMLTSLTSSAESSADEQSDTEIKLPRTDKSEMSKSVTTLLSRDLKKMPWDELYDCMNKQHQSVDEDFVGALDIEPCEFPCYNTDSPSQFNSQLEESFQNTNEREGEADDETERKAPIQNAEGEMFENGVLMYEQGATGTSPTKERSPPYTELGETEPVQMRNAPDKSPPSYTTLPPLNRQFYDTFELFFEYIEEEDQMCSLFSKLGVLTKTVKYVGEQISRNRVQGLNSAPCADDLLDVVTLLLCKLDKDWLFKLYSHLNLILCLLPDFMQGNAHEYSLVNFSMAYSYLFEKQLMHKNSTNDVSDV